MDKPDPRLANLRPKSWPKGVSGNPNGRPKKPSMNAELARKFNLDPGRLSGLVEAGIKAAENGDFRYWKEIFDRLDGKIPSPVEITEKQDADTGILVRVPPVSTDGSDGSSEKVLE